MPFLILFLALALLGSSGPAQEPPPEKTRHEMPAGWKMRLDHPERAGHSGDEVPFWDMPPGWHITTGPACILYDPAQTVRGQYRVQATTFLFDPGTRREGYGVFIGGRDLEGDAQSYTYFLLRRDARFLIKQREGSETREIVPWTEHSAIVAYDGSAASAKNVLAIEVGADEVAFFVNDQEVVRLPRAAVNTDGIVGLRINHSLNLHVSELTVEARPRATPPPAFYRRVRPIYALLLAPARW